MQSCVAIVWTVERMTNDDMFPQEHSTLCEILLYKLQTIAPNSLISGKNTAHYTCPLPVMVTIQA